MFEEEIDPEKNKPIVTERCMDDDIDYITCDRCHRWVLESYVNIRPAQKDEYGSDESGRVYYGKGVVYVCPDCNY